MTHFSLHQTYHTQRGATLIVVLMLLLMISVVGVVALKQSSTDLKLATSDQVNTLLLQASDSPLDHLESMINDKDNSSLTADDKKLAAQKYNDLVEDRSGAFGRFMLNKEKTADEVYSYCFTPNTNYLTNNATIGKSGGIVVTSGLGGLSNGSCYKDDKENFSTNMGVAITQVNIKKSENREIPIPFDHMVTGVSVKDKTLAKSTTLDINITSAIPAYGNAIKAGYTHNVYSDPDALVTYLKDKDTPYSTVYSKVRMLSQVESVGNNTTGDDTGSANE